jgi:hypothetical protein
MKCLFLFLLLAVNVYTNTSNTEKKFKRKLRKINDAYSLIDSEMTMDLPKIQEVERPFPLEDSNSFTQSLRFAQTEGRNSFSNSFGMGTNLKTFGTDFDIKPQIAQKKEVTYRKPIYFDPMGNYKSVNVASSNSNDDETKFLETFSNTGSSSSYVTQSKDIVFNSNQIDYEPSSYRSAYVLGQNPSNIQRHEKRNNLISQTENKEVKLSQNENKRNKLTSTTSTNTQQEKIPEIHEIKKLENEKNFTNHFNVTSQVLNLSNHKNKNSYDSSNSTDAKNATDPFFNNEKEINDLSLKLSNMFKNILLNIVHNKNKNIDKLIQNSSEEVNEEIKNSLKKLRKNKEDNNHSKKSPIIHLDNKFTNKNKTEKLKPTIISKSYVDNLKSQSEITKKVYEKIEKNIFNHLKESESFKIAHLNETYLFNKSEIQGINMIQKSDKLGKVDFKKSVLNSTIEKEKMISSRLEEIKEKIKEEKKKLATTNIPFSKVSEIRKKPTIINNKPSAINKPDSNKKITEDKKILKKKEATNKPVLNKKSEVLIKPKEALVPSHTPTPIKNLKTQKSINILNRSSITEIEKQILSKIPKKLPNKTKPLGISKKVKQDNKKIAIVKKAQPDNRDIKTKSKILKSTPVPKESHIDRMIKDNAEKLKKIKEASEKLKAKLNLKTPISESIKHHEIISIKKEIKSQPSKDLIKDKQLIHVNLQKETKKDIKSSGISSIKEEFDDSSMISELLKNLEK